MEKLTAMAAASCLALSVSAAVEWPSNFDEKLSEHIAAEMSTNTTAAVCEFSIDACYRTCGSCGFSVMRTPPGQPGMCIIIL